MRKQWAAAVLALILLPGAGGCAPRVEELDFVMYAVSEAVVREKPSSKSAEIGRLQAEEPVSVTGQTEERWYRVEYRDTVGYVFRDNLTREKAAPAAAPLESTAPQQEPAQPEQPADEMPEPDPGETLLQNIMGTWYNTEDNSHSVRIDSDSVQIVSGMEILIISYYVVSHIDAESGTVLIDLYAVYDPDTDRKVRIDPVTDKMEYDGGLRYTHNLDSDNEVVSLWRR